MNPASISPSSYLDYGALGIHALLIVALVIPLVVWLAKSLKSAQERNIADLRTDLNEAKKAREASQSMYERVVQAVEKLTDSTLENTNEVRQLRAIFEARIKTRG